MPSYRKTITFLRQCRKCGAKADQRDRFCRLCGFQLTPGRDERPATSEAEPKPAPAIEVVPKIPSILVEPLLRKIEQLESEKEILKLKLLKQRLGLPKLVASSLLTIGVLAMISSIIFFSSILAFIGLGLTFWGVLFLFIRPTAYVKTKLLNSTAVSSLIAIDKILGEEAFQGKALHLAPKYKDGLKDVMVFIPAKNGVAIPSTDEIIGGKVILKNSQGLCLLSPGHGLVELFEKELGVDFSKVDLNYLQKNLPKLLVEDLEVVEEFSMNVDGEFVQVRMVGSIYRDLCCEVKKLANICPHMGCPICSAIACVLAKTSGNPVVFEGDKLSTDSKEVLARFRIVED